MSLMKSAINLTRFRNQILLQPITSSLTHNIARLYCDNHSNENRPNSILTKTESKPGLKNDQTGAGLESKYTIFRESDASVLLDVYEEKLQLEIEELQRPAIEQDEFYGLNLKRGVCGVFDIEDCIDLLRRDKAEDIFVAVLPPEINYVDYIVVVNGRSRRHMIAMADIVRRVFKKKMLPTDIIPRIEGENSDDWIALDLGNIALHIFSRDARKVYDLESLWSVGPEFDSLTNQQDDPLITLLKKHSISFQEVNMKGELL